MREEGPLGQLWGGNSDARGWNRVSGAERERSEITVVTGASHVGFCGTGDNFGFYSTCEGRVASRGVGPSRLCFPKATRREVGSPIRRLLPSSRSELVVVMEAMGGGQSGYTLKVGPKDLLMRGRERKQESRMAGTLVSTSRQMELLFAKIGGSVRAQF